MNRKKTSRNITTLAVLFVLAGVGIAAEPAASSFRDHDAASAKRRHDREVRETRERYFETMLDIKDDYIRDLRKALENVDKDNPDEAAKIDREIKRITDEIAKLERDRDTGGIDDRNLETDVQANRDWQEIIEVRRGDVIKVEASGSWTGDRRKKKENWVGPEGYKGGAGALQGKIGEQRPFVVGTGTEIRVTDDGVLSMRMFDTEFEDNAGYVTVKLTFTRTGKGQ